MLLQKDFGWYIFLIKTIIIAIFYCAFTFQSFSQGYIIDGVIFKHKDTKSFDDGQSSDAVAITGEKTYKPQTLKSDVPKLMKFYFDNGFFDIKIDTAVEYNDYDAEVTVNFIIKENRHYRIDTLQYIGLQTISKKIKYDIDTTDIIKTNDYYNKGYIIQKSAVISDLLQNNGYMNAIIKPDSGIIIIKHDTSVTAQLHFEHVDTIYKFGKTSINVINNVYNVDENLFPKVITFNKGDIYSKAEKLATERNMAQYGIVLYCKYRIN